jgi:predicted flap endonuclease-1-like 5' DNA nuclease
MAILDTILSVLGLKSSDSRTDTRDRSTDVSVEHDPDAENEASVKGVETSSGTEEAAAAGTDATGSTGSVTEEPPETESAAEPAEAAGGISEEGNEHEAAEPAEAAGPVGDESDPDAESEAATDPVDTVSGIGPAYAEKLGGAGIETVGELAAADPEALAEETDISEKRLGRLIERAGERL